MEIYIDGASSGNPGPAGVGAVILENKRVVKNISVHLGIQTNNVAEYMALIFALQEALIRRADTLKIYTDSELLCKQVNNEYKIKSPNLIGLYHQVKHLFSGFQNVEVKHIRREKNRQADRLAKRAIIARRYSQAKVAALPPELPASSHIGRLF